MNYKRQQLKKLLLMAVVLAVPRFGINQELSESFQKLDEEINRIMKSRQVPGVAISLFNRDSMIYEAGYQNEDLVSDIEVNEHTLFRVGSITKTFVALGIMKLVEEGRFQP